MTLKRLLFALFVILIFVNIWLLGAYRLSLKEMITPLVGEVVQKVSKSEYGKTTVVLGGDVMLGRSVMTKSLSLGNPSYPFTGIEGFLKSADLVFVNLEAPFADGCPKMDAGMVFCADPVLVQGLVEAGVDVVNLGNNHILNYGRTGLQKTKEVLSRNKIESVGFGEMVIKKVKGVKFGFLGFDFLSGQPTEKDYEIIKKGKNRVDVLVVGIHWGSEYQGKANDEQRMVAKRVIEAGADVIAGHHPHWVQEWEYINGKPVFYSLGNLIFDQMWSEETRRGMLAELTFTKKKLTGVKTHETYMSSWAQPEMVK